jgi:DNA-binding PadR family transcriptional regulator
MSELVAYTRSNLPKTPKTKKDRRTRSDLTVFVLALVGRGLNTPYLLRESAALSPGATIPVLARLVSSGYLRKGAEESRGRVEYALTSKGEALLSNSWRELFQTPPTTELDTILRTASLALLMGEPRRSVAEYLSRAEESRKDRQTAETPPRVPESTLEAFPWMRETALLSRNRSEASVLRKLASKLQTVKKK